MTEISRPWTGTVTGDAGPYSADQWSRLQRLMIPGASHPDAGVVAESGTAPDLGLSVRANSPAAANVIISPGTALVHGTFYDNTADVTLAIAANSSGNTRIDTIILRKTWATQTIRLVVLQGTPAGSPVPPALTQSDTVQWEIPLADITVVNGFTVINASDIRQRKIYLSAEMEMVRVLNNSGGALDHGDVVVWDTTTNQAVTTSTTRAVATVAGVVMGRIANGAYGYILRKGKGYVYVNGAVATRGNNLMQSTSAKQAESISDNSTTSARRTFASALETTSGAGLCLCMVNVGRENHGVSAETKPDAVADWTSTSANWVYIDSGVWTFTIWTNTGVVELGADGLTLSSINGVNSTVDFTVDGVTVQDGGSIGGGGGSGTFGSGGTVNLMNGVVIVKGLTVGSHTFRLAWWTSGGATVTLSRGAGGVRPNFWVKELDV